MDADTKWEEVFDGLTTSEQECVRDTFDGDMLESVLDRSVMWGSDTVEAWEISIFSCLAPETARSVFVSLMLEEAGLSLEDLSEEEATCLRAWVTETDWTTLTGATDDASTLIEFFAGLLDCVPDPSWSEPGDRPWDEVIEEATPGGIGETTPGELGFGGESDTFAFQAAEGDQLYELDITLGTLADYVLDIYDADGTRLAIHNAYGDEGQDRLIWSAPGTGTYYVQVTSFLADTGTYTLTISIPDIVDDHPNSTGNATPVEIGAATQGALDHEGDSDYFAFQATEGASYQLDVTLANLEESVLYLFDADAIWLDITYDYGDSPASRLIWQAPTTGTYYIQVTSYDGGTYTLTIAS